MTERGTFKIRRSNVKGRVPTVEQLLEGELAVNTADRVTYMRAGSEVIELARLSQLTSNTVRVQTDAGVMEFDTISEAIDSITDASSVKPYEVKVAPGVYTDNLVMKPYVFVVADDPGTVIISAADPDVDVVTACNYSSIVGVTLTGATGTGAAAIGFTDAVEDLITLGFFARSVRFGHNSINVRCTSTDKITTIFLMDCRFGSIYSYDKAFLVQSSNGGNARVIARSCTTNGSTAPLPTDFAYVTGPGAELMFLSCIFWGNVFTPTGNGVHLRDGGVARLIGTHMRGFNRGLWAENAGAAPNILAEATLEGNVNDIIIDHPGTTGSFRGTADRTKTTIDPDSSVSVFYADPVNKGVTVVGPLFIGEKHSEITDVTDLIQESSPAGVLSGGVMSRSVNPLDISVTGGYGYVQDNTSLHLKKVAWDEQILTLPSSADSYVYFDNDGVLTSSTSRPSVHSALLLGSAHTRDGAIVLVSNYKFDSKHAATHIDDFIRRALGPIFASGCLVAENATTNRALDVGSGSYWLSHNEYVVDGGNAITFFDIYHAGGAITESEFINQVDNTQYDDGTNLVNLSTGYYTKHALYMADGSDEEIYAIVHGRGQFDTLLGAQQAALPSTPTYFNDITVPLAAIIVQEGNDHIVEILDIRPRVGFQSPANTASDRHGNLMGLLNDDHPQYLLTNGDRQLTGNLDLNNHDLINVGTLNGLDITAHASRHLPNGADPLTTASAVGLNASSTNTAGVNNSFARSDHTHQITGFIPSSSLGAANGAAQLGSDGKLLSSQLSALAITDTFPVASQAAMLALTAQRGDVAVRTDISESYILTTDDPTQLANWQQLLHPAAPVTSVNGQTGAVNLSTSNISEGSNLYFTNARASAAAPVQSVNSQTGAVNITTVTGNAGTASKLQTARTINGASFDGSANISFNTDAVAEGTTNKYYTAARAQADVTSVTGNSGTASKLQTARTINGTSFDGSANISFNTDSVAEGTTNKYYTAARAQADVTSVSGNAGSATQLQTSRNFSITGEGSASAVGFNGTSNVALALTLANDLTLHGTGGINLPAGTTAQRKAGAADGALRYSTDLVNVEALVAGSWKQFVLGSSDLAAISLRRTTALTLGTTQVDVTFDTIDYNNQSTVLARDAVTSRLDILVSGIYLLMLNGETVNGTNANFDLFQLKVNGTALPNGLVTTNSRSTRETFAKTIPVYLNAGDYVSVAAYSNTGATGTLQIGMTLSAVKLVGAQGPAGVSSGQSTIYYAAANFDNPNNSNWAVNALAPVVADTTNAGLAVRTFDDTAEEGIGCTVQVPSAVSNIVFTITGKCATAPATAKQVMMRLFNRAVNLNAAVGAWSSGFSLAAINIPTNAYYQSFTLTVPLSSVGMAANGLYQLELTRQGSNVSDTLVGDFHLLNTTISFS